MPRRALPALATTGRPELEQLEANVRRALDQGHGQLGALDATDIAYAPGTPSNWVSPAPTTVQQALDRLAAAGGTVPVP